MLSVFSNLIFGSPKLLGFRQDGKIGLQSWKDKSIRFDLKGPDLELKDAEQLIACFFPIEDIKGNPTELGYLKITNLRLIWRCCGKKRVNLSIGWRTVSLIFEQTLKDSLGSPVSSICVLTRYESTKYEFIFNQMPSYSESVVNQMNYNFLDALKKSLNDKTLNLTHLTPVYLADPFETVLKTLQCYKSTWLFRQCQANMARLVSGANDDDSKRMPNRHFEIEKLNWLPSEEMIDHFPGICLVESRSTRHIGTLILTNIRVIWVDDNLSMRNLSIPYIRVISLKVKSPERIVISTCDYLATTNQVELRTPKPSGKLSQSNKSMFDQIQKLCNLYKSRPHYGPESCEDCINFMCLLKPIELYFDRHINEMSVDELSNTGQQSSVDYGWRMLDPVRDREASISKNTLDSSQDDNEEELNAYNSKLNKYLDEMPTDRDKELELTSAFGLAFEKPDKGVELRRLWSLEVT